MTNNWINSIDKTWSLFLDRDGVINKRIIDGYVKKSMSLYLLTVSLKRSVYLPRNSTKYSSSPINKVSERVL